MDGQGTSDLTLSNQSSCNGGDCACAKIHSRERILERGQEETKKIKKSLIQISSGFMLFLLGLVLEYSSFSIAFAAEALFFTSYLILGAPILWRAAKNMRKKDFLDENFLMSIATIGALFIGQWGEAAAVMLFYQVGELFQEMALHRSKKSIQNLLDLRPDKVNLLEGDKIMEVEPGDLLVGQIFLVQPGERVPLDGVVKTGRSEIDTAALTGEALPRSVEPGDNVLSGCINKGGVLTVEITKVFAESTVNKIIDLVIEASEKKASTEKFITRFAKVYTPVVVGAALAVAFIPPLFGMGSLSEWIYRGLAFLVISCPCALVISIPLGYFGGIGAASKQGILVKGSQFLDAAAKPGKIVFDKTGTLTTGVFHVEKILTVADISEMELLRLAATAERFSNHPIALSVKARAGDLELWPTQPEDYKEIPGRGVQVTVDEDQVLVGNLAFMEESGITVRLNDKQENTALYIARNQQLLGWLEIGDQIKAEAKATIGELKSLGIKDFAVVTGDRRNVADGVAQELGVNQVFSELLPQDKLTIVESMILEKSEATQPSKEGNSLIFVGDGINDAPVLARADVGIAIGAMASGAAVEAADIVFMGDELSLLPKTIRIARKTRRIVWQNIIFALAVKALVMILAALGVTNLWMAIFADVGVSILAILNAMRAGK